MAFGMVSIFLLVVAAVFVLGGLYLLMATGWFVQFLRGFAGFGLILLAALVVMMGLNLASYNQLEEEGDIATVSFSKVNEQMYEATVASVLDGVEHKYTIEGDLWQLESRQMFVFSSTPFYMPEKITGRYYSIEQQRISAPSTFTLPDNSIGLNLWGIFANKDIGIISASLQKTSFMPMADGAMYSVKVGENGLESKPVNEAATTAFNEWH